MEARACGAHAARETPEAVPLAAQSVPEGGFNVMELTPEFLFDGAESDADLARLSSRRGELEQSFKQA